MKLLPRSLLRQNLLLIAGLVIAAQLATASAFYYLMQRPRALHTVQLAVQQIQWMQASLAALPQSERQRYVAQINESGVATLTPFTAQRTFAREVPSVLGMRMFVRALQRELTRAGIESHWQNQPVGGLYLKVMLGDAPYWFHLSLEQLARTSLWPWLVALLASAVLTIAGAFAIQRHISRPLTQLVDATRQLEQGRQPQRLPEQGATEIAALTTAFNQMVDKLAQIDADRALMLAGVSHDLRTPLAKLNLAVSLLESKSDPQLVAQIQRHVDEMDGLIGQFVDFARSGNEEAVEPVDLAQLLQQLADYFARQGARFELLCIGLPQQLACRPAALRRALVNLLDNAVKYGAPPWQIRAEVRDGWLRIAIIDHGPGIADAGRLAQPFVRGSDARHGKPGTGLGLAIVERVASLHGGRMELLAGEQGGLQAVFALPLVT